MRHSNQVIGSAWNPLLLDGGFSVLVPFLELLADYLGGTGDFDVGTGRDLLKKAPP
jgi:hypothetical protein